MPIRPSDVHREEADVEADEHDPERPLAEPLAHEPAGELREPVVDAADDREDVDADQHVVQVGDDEVGVGELPVDRHRGGHEAGDAADHEDDHEAGEEQERRGELRPAGPDRRHPGEHARPRSG